MGVKVQAQLPQATGHVRNAWIWGVLLLAGLAWGSYSLLRHSHKPTDFAWQNWLDGTAGHALNQALRLPGHASLETAMTAARYRMLGDTGAQVALGCPEWLFYRDGLRPQPGTGDTPFEARKRMVLAWSQALQKDGIRTLVVAVPDKSRVESQHLCGLTVAPVLQARLVHWQQHLQSHGVDFVDLRAALQPPAEGAAFFRTDVHMNPWGARTAALAVGAAALPLLGGQVGAQVFETQTPEAATPLEGDLLVLAGLQHAPAGWRPAHDLVQIPVTSPVRAGGLLDESPPVEVLLAGSSNSLRSDFPGQLGQALGREVWNLSMDGGQFSGAFMQALQQRSTWPPSVKLVIWEFSENTLSLPLSSEELRMLAAIESPENQ